MCTITYDKPELKIAEEDIVVYKEININRKFWFFKKSYKSKHAKFEYKKGKVHETDLGQFLRSYDRTLDERCIYQSTTGFYSYKEPWWFINAIFVIPKGSQYYLCKDRDGSYIYHSDKIKLVEILK